jgi:hypothetical protein
MPALAGLTVSQRRTISYKTGGLAVALAFNTFDATGANQATVDATNKLTVATGAVIVRLEFEENEGLYSDSTTIGANRFPKHTVGYKFAGRSQSLNDLAVTLDLLRTTHVVKTRGGEFLVLGLTNGLIAEKDDSTSGAKLEDFNGFDVVLSGGETAKALVIDEATFLALATRVTT